MRSRAAALAVVILSCLLAAFSTGSKIYLLFAVLMAVMAFFAILSVRLAGRSASVSHSLSSQRVQRGETVTLEVSVKHRGFLPIAPITLTLLSAPG